MPTAFISDLHLDENHPNTMELFMHFVHEVARHCDTLYILGDLFEQWIGDDASSLFQQRVIKAIKQLTDHGVRVYVMRGNRDFLLGQRFAQQTGCQLLPDMVILDLYGKQTLLCHGDTLCTDDVAYLRMRKYIQHPVVKSLFLASPVRLRQYIAKKLRSQSQKKQTTKNPAHMDANHNAIKACMHKTQVELLIHGHTHEPNLHCFYLDGNNKMRIVLSDWTNRGHMLICHDDGSKALYYFDNDAKIKGKRSPCR